MRPYRTSRVVLASAGRRFAPALALLLFAVLCMVAITDAQHMTWVPPLLAMGQLIAMTIGYAVGLRITLAVGHRHSVQQLPGAPAVAAAVVAFGALVAASTRTQGAKLPAIVTLCVGAGLAAGILVWLLWSLLPHRTDGGRPQGMSEPEVAAALAALETELAQRSLSAPLPSAAPPPRRREPTCPDTPEESLERHERRGRAAA